MSEIKRYNVGYLGLEEAKNGRYVAHGDYLEEVRKLRAEIDEAYDKGYDEGRWVGYHELNQDMNVCEIPV